MSTKVVKEIKRTFSSLAPTSVLLSQESLRVGLTAGPGARRDVRREPGASSVPAAGRWPRSAGGQRGQETLPQTPECRARGHPSGLRRGSFRAVKGQVIVPRGDSEARCRD